MKILIVGSFPYAVPFTQEDLAQNPNLPDLFERFKGSCRALGRQLGTQGGTLFVGSDRTVDADTYVVEGFNEAPLAAPQRKHRMVVYTPDDWRRSNPPFSDRLAELANLSVDYLQVPGPWVKATNSIMRETDAVLVIGGRGATLQAGMAAPALGKPPVAVTAFHGAAGQVFDVMQWSYVAAGLDGVLLNSLRGSFETEDAARNVMRAVQHLAKANPFRIKTGLVPRCVAFAAVLALIAAWVWVLIDGSAQTKTELAQGAALTQPAGGGQEQPHGKSGAAPAADRKGQEQPHGKSGAAPAADRKGKAGQSQTKSDTSAQNKGPEPSGIRKSNPGGPPSEKPKDVPADEKKQGQESPLPVTGPAGNDQSKTDGTTDTGTRQVQDIGERTPHLIGLLVISAMLGILFRASIRLFRNQVVHVADLINEFTVGVLLAFGFLVLYLTGGILYQGDSLAVSPENFRRVGTSVTVLGLASAVVLEGAIAEIRRRFAQILRR